MHARYPIRIASAVLFAGLLTPGTRADGGTIATKSKSPRRSEYVDFQRKAHLKIPSGLTLLTGEELDAYLSAAGTALEPGQIGLLMADEGKWTIKLGLSGEDPLDGVPKEEVAARADTILAGLRAKYDAANKERVAAGKPAVRITGWTHKPLFDSAANRVTWGYRLTDDASDDSVVVVTYLFGPPGSVVELTLHAELNGYSRPLAEYRKVSDAVRFGSAPGLEWLSVSALTSNENALFVGAGVMLVIGAGGMVLRRSSGERKRATPAPRSW